MVGLLWKRQLSIRVTHNDTVGVKERPDIACVIKSLWFALTRLYTKTLTRTDMSGMHAEEVTAIFAAASAARSRKCVDLTC